MRIALPAVFATAAALAACTPPAPQPAAAPPPAAPGRISTRDVPPRDTRPWQLPGPALAIDSIALRRGVCYGRCPVYDVVLRADGTAEWRGERNTERLGRWTAQVGPDAFRRLAYMAGRLGVAEMDSVYRRPVTDVPAAEVRVWSGGARAPKVIRDEFAGNAGPPELWAFEQLIDAVAGAAFWTREGQ